MKYHQSIDKGIDTEILDYHLPGELVAQYPAYERDSSKLMVLKERGQVIIHSLFHDILKFLEKDDLLVVNDTKVFNARLHTTRSTGGKMEIFFLNPVAPEPSGSGKIWECIVRPSRKVRVKEEMEVCEGLRVRFEEKVDDCRWVVQCFSREDVINILDRLGTLPLPPYIKRRGKEDHFDDGKRYQTVYAKDPRSVAAPTAGLHFTQTLLKTIEKETAGIVPISLSVGYGTFAPIRSEVIQKHSIHTESYLITPDVAQIISRHKRSGGKVVAVGTTSVRCLEASFDDAHRPIATRGSTDLFIYPGYRFKMVDALITNFHLPRSSLLALVMAFAGIDVTRSSYGVAIGKGYRFFSYGDAMLIR